MGMRCPYCHKIIGMDRDNQIRKARVQRGLTAAQAAQQVGVSLSTWYQWESGSKFPGPANRAKLEAWLRKGGR